MTALINQQYGHIRGFNYQPSYGSHGLETWGDRFDAEAIRQELGRGKMYFPGMNTIRLWLSFDAFIRCGSAVPERFEQALEVAASLGLQVIPTLFNGWHSLPDFGGISVEVVSYWGGPERFDQAFRPYVESMVGPHVDDPRILLWDLCNEPFNSSRCEDSRTSILRWLESVFGTCKALGATAPISVGSVPSLDSVKWLAPVSEVINFHPYYAWNAWVRTPEAFVERVEEAVAYANAEGKAMIATETGWGALDDEKRVEVLRVELGTLAERGIGFTAHLLHHTLVADGHRPEYGPITSAGYMAFVEQDGSLRPGHEVFNDF